jgi:hypothetical protein
VVNCANFPLGFKQRIYAAVGDRAIVLQASGGNWQD